MEQNNQQMNQQFNQQMQRQDNEQTEQQRKRRKTILSFVGVAILVIGLVGVTYAFFNYTRTGTANTIKTGRIAFDADQSAAVTLSDLFPIDVTGEVTTSTPGVGVLTVHVTGDTDYEDGIEYLVKAVNVTGSNQTSLPISIGISYEASDTQGATIGTADDSYFTNRGGNASLYKVLTTDTISEGKDLVVGYIAPGATGIDGNIVIMAYLDARNIAITDTYPEGVVFGLNDNMTQEEAAACASNIATGYATGETAADFCAGTGTRNGKTFQEHLDEELFTAGELTTLANAGVILELYTNGTTTEWVHARTVLTTTEWNSLQSSGVSFQVRVEANEGTWVPNPGSATLSLSPVSGTISLGTATTTTSTITTNGDGVLSCASSDDTIATCSVANNTLTVTGVAAGNATITVTEAAGTLYSTAATATYDVTVTS